MHTEWLSDWALLVIQTSVEKAMERGELEVVSGNALLVKLASATAVRLSYPDQPSPGMWDAVRQQVVERQ